MVKWLKVGGYIFFRESCFHQSGDLERKVNPTHYREPRFYTKVRTENPNSPTAFPFASMASVSDSMVEVLSSYLLHSLVFLV